MTSKEILERLQNMAISNGYETSVYDLGLSDPELFKSIRDNFEILDILRSKMSLYETNYGDDVIEFNGNPVIRIDRDDVEYHPDMIEGDIRIKEWLKEGE